MKLAAPRVTPQTAARTATGSVGSLPLMRTLTCAAMLAFGAHAAAQSDTSTEMSLEELEAYIAKQKAALDTVIENRELTARKAESVTEALEKAQAREAEVQAELETLCEQREQLEAGSLEGCLENNGG